MHITEPEISSMESILRLNEFFVEGGKQDLSHVLLHITEPSTAEEAAKGYFFALCEVNNAEPAFIKKLQEMIDRAENEYYEILTAEAEKDSFEAVLEKLNGEAFTLEKARGDLHCIVGAIRPEGIIFSYFGNPHLLLFYKNRLGNYEKMDLIRGNGEDTAVSEDDGLFSQIIQGKLSPNDYLFAGTPHLVDFFSHDRLEKIITTRSAQQSAQHLEKVLGELKNGYSFGGLIINLFQPELDDVAIKKARTVTPGASTASLKKLFQRENETANTLSPPLFGNLNNFKDDRTEQSADEFSASTKESPANQPAEIMSSHLSTRRPKNKPQRQNLGDRLAPIISRIIPAAQMTGQFLLQLLVLIYTFFFNLFRVITLLFIVLINYRNRRNTIIENWRHSWRGFKENIRHLPLTTKLMLFGSIILAVGFLISIVYIRHRQNVIASDLNFSRALQDLKDRRGSVESALIYKNDELALSEFQAARDLLQKLPCNSAERMSDCNDITNQLNVLSVKLRKVLPLNTTLLGVFPMPSSASNAKLIKIKNKLIAYSASTSTLFVYDLMNNEFATISTYPSISGFTGAGVPKENDYVLFLYNGNQLMQLNPVDLTTKLIDLSFSTKASLAGLVIYNRRLYTLDNLKGTIFRHDPIKTGFGKGVEWLTDKSVSLTDASDLAIDGDMFVSKNNGQIEKYTKGILQPFSLLGLDPSLGAGTRLFTYSDISYLYILDPQNKRLIIFEKNGHLIGQMTNDSLKNPTGMVVDSAAKTVYFLDSGKLLKAPLQQ